jgi:hypothetical protein
MDIKSRYIRLYLKNGSLDGFFHVEDINTIATIYSCPRDSITDLINEKNSGYFGVYFLLSSKQVYIGQASNLLKRVEQHKIGKDWWERVVILTTKDDSLNKTKIDYLESEFIKKANLAGTLDIDNKNNGVKHKVDRFDEEFLNQFINDALVILELIGIKVFKTKNEKKPNNFLDTKPNIGNKSLLQKNEAKQFLLNLGVKLDSPFTYARRQIKHEWFWANPDVSLLNEDWYLVLNDQFLSKIYVLLIPSKTFKLVKNNSRRLLVRKDKPQYLDLSIRSTDFVDNVSKMNFKDYIIKTIDY